MTEIETMYELPNYAYKKYKQVVKGNENTSHEMARKKLTRNILLGKRVYKDHTYNQELYLYGHLKLRVNITIDNRRVITGIWNNCRPDEEWTLHAKKYAKLNKRLGIGG